MFADREIQKTWLALVWKAKSKIFDNFLPPLFEYMLVFIGQSKTNFLFEWSKTVQVFEKFADDCGQSGSV
jgi:hypothetical protein